MNPAIKTRLLPLDVSKAEPKEYAQLFNNDQATSIVISNAGIMHNSRFLETDPARIEAMIKTNVHPQIYLTKYAMQHFEKTH